MTTYYRNVIQVEILSDVPLAGLGDLDQVHYLITEGPCSGMVTGIVTNEEVSRDAMAELLTAQGSDPEFLISDLALDS